MSRYMKLLTTGMGRDQAAGVISAYLVSEGFKQKVWQGQQVWQKGGGFLAVPQFIMAEPAEGSVNLQAWTAGYAFFPGVYAGEMDPFVGVWGAAPKAMLKGRVNELERRLGSVAPPAPAVAATPADWYPDPAGRHELRYFDGSAWTDQVSDAGQQSTDGQGAS